jgi:Leucine-rich repeat (LRR) protein
MTKEDLYDINGEDNLNNQILHNIYNNGLVMKEMNLKNIPVEEMQNCIQKNSLNKIDFSMNQINDINNLTYVLNRIESISELNLSNNLIETFPLIILSLPNLSILNLSKNKLQKFPFDEFTSTNLSQIKCDLTALDLSFNYLIKFPDVIGLFQNMSNLNLATNNIISIENILNMKLYELDTLNLSDNKIEKLPNKLYKIIPKLKCFLMSNNNLKDIPSDICLLKYLNNINFYGNQIRRIRNDALTSATILLDYLRKIHIFDDEDKMSDLNNNNNFQNQNNNFGNNNNKIKQRIEYKIMDTPSYHDTHGYNYQYKNQAYNNKNINQINRNNNQIGFEQNLNNNFYINQQNNDNFQINNKINNIQEDIKMRTLDDINKDIANIEEEMSVPTLPQYQKAALRKKYHALLVERSKYLK